MGYAKKAKELWKILDSRLQLLLLGDAFTEVFKRIFGGSTTANRFARICTDHTLKHSQQSECTILLYVYTYDIFLYVCILSMKMCATRPCILCLARCATNIFLRFWTSLQQIFQETAPSSQDKDESGFASIDELDPKSAKATWANDLIVGREDCGVGNPRFEFPFEAVDGDNPGKSFGASWGGIPHQTRERFLC